MDDPVAAAAIERLQEHRRRLIADKVAKGEAVLRAGGTYAVIGSPCRKRIQALGRQQQCDEQGRKIFYEQESTVIITGVPEDNFPCPDCDGDCAKPEPEHPECL